MAHIKRAKVAEEAKKEAENPIKGKRFSKSYFSRLVIKDLMGIWRIELPNISFSIN